MFRSWWLGGADNCSNGLCSGGVVHCPNQLGNRSQPFFPTKWVKALLVYNITPARKRRPSLKRQRRTLPSLALQAWALLGCRRNIPHRVAEKPPKLESFATSQKGITVLTLMMLTALSAGLPDAASSVNEPEKADGFVPLFNGKDLTGWKKYDTKADVWSAQDGLIVCSGKGGGWLGTDRDYADFVLRLEYRLTPGGNSGVYVRAPETGHISRVGMEIQILDDNAPQYARLDFYQYTGSIYHVVAPTRRAGKPAGEWNTLEIRALGRQVVVILNGKKIVDADLDRCLTDPAVAREHPGLARTTGRIGLQSHSERVEFRNLRVKEVKSGQP